MKRLVALSLLGSLAASAAFAAPPARIRGTLMAVSTTTITVRTTAGAVDSISLTPKTRYVAVTKASLADVRAGRYIGTATKEVGGQQVALEVAIFPETMRGVGEGHYPWDTIPDTTMPARTSVDSSMTNGNVSMAMPAPRTASSMTNGNVQAAGGAGGDKTLTVTYSGGLQTIIVPPSAPIVLLNLANHDVLQPGAGVMVLGTDVQGKMTALAVSAGVDGVKPPM